MKLEVLRETILGNSVFGRLLIDGQFFCYTLERKDTLIPDGMYPLVLTVSQRCCEGELWSSDPQHRLPLVENVPGRSGIRLHAANEWTQLEGCTAVGYGLDLQRKPQPRITISQRALTALIAKLEQAFNVRDAVTVEYRTGTSAQQ